MAFKPSNSEGVVTPTRIRNKCDTERRKGDSFTSVSGLQDLYLRYFYLNFFSTSLQDSHTRCKNFFLIEGFARSLLD